MQDKTINKKIDLQEKTYYQIVKYKKTNKNNIHKKLNGNRKIFYKMETKNSET